MVDILNVDASKRQEKDLEAARTSAKSLEKEELLWRVKVLEPQNLATPRKIQRK